MLPYSTAHAVHSIKRSLSDESFYHNYTENIKRSDKHLTDYLTDDEAEPEHSQ